MYFDDRIIMYTDEVKKRKQTVVISQTEMDIQHSL